MQPYTDFQRTLLLGLVIAAGASSLGYSASSACDVNGDGNVNVSDIQSEVNQALRVSSCVNDLNADGTCSVLDVQLIANAALTGSCSGSTSSGGRPAIPASGAYLGIETNGGYSTQTQFETLFGRQFAILHTNWSDGYQFAAAGYVQSINANHNTIPMLTFATLNRTLKEIITNTINPADRRANYQNSPDSLFKSWADSLKAYGKPVFVRFNHEMNGNWYPYCFQPSEGECVDQDTGVPQTPADFVNAWRHMHDIFVAEGATNVSFVWCPNEVEGAGPHKVAFSTFYPGDAYVDWTCYDAYNWNNPPVNTTSDDSFSKISLNTYNQVLAVAPNKPMMIGEFNTDLEGDPTGTKKAAWLIDAYQQIRTNFPAIKAAVIFDVDTHPNEQVDWRVENTAAATAGLKQAISSSYFLSQ